MGKLGSWLKALSALAWGDLGCILSFTRYFIVTTLDPCCPRAGSTLHGQEQEGTRPLVYASLQCPVFFLEGVVSLLVSSLGCFLVGVATPLLIFLNLLIYLLYLNALYGSLVLLQETKQFVLFPKKFEIINFGQNNNNLIFCNSALEAEIQAIKIGMSSGVVFLLLCNQIR